MELLLRIGDPLDVIPDLLTITGATEVAWSELPGYRECRQSSRLREALYPLLGSGGIYTTCSYALYHPDDLPCGGDGDGDCDCGGRGRGERIRTWRDLARPNERRPGGGKKGKSRAGRTGGRLGRRSAVPPPAADDDVVENDAIDATMGGGGKNDDDDARTSSHRPGATNATNANVDVGRFVGMPRVMGDYRRAVRTHARVRGCSMRPRVAAVLPNPRDCSAGRRYRRHMSTTGRWRTMREICHPSRNRRIDTSGPCPRHDGTTHTVRTCESGSIGSTICEMSPARRRILR